MIHPSYVDLMNVVNKGVEEGEAPVISSRYSIVMATSKRARQIIAGDEEMVSASEKDKPLTVAVRELYEDKLSILTDEEKEDMAKLIEKQNEEDAIEEARLAEEEKERERAEKAAKAEKEAAKEKEKESKNKEKAEAKEAKEAKEESAEGNSEE